MDYVMEGNVIEVTCKSSREKRAFRLNAQKEAYERANEKKGVEKDA